MSDASSAEPTTEPTVAPTVEPTVELDRLRAALEDVADPAKVPQMRAYMKDRFDFLGVGSTDRKQAQRPLLARCRSASPDEVVAVAEACWREPEREFQYVGADLLRRHATRLDARHLTAVRRLIETRAWWDTVDTLAANVIGPMVATVPELVDEMDAWIAHDDLWIARTAILHQLTYGAATDVDRLFRYCAMQAHHRDFFVRKAIGWALRQYARTDPQAVLAWVEAHESELSGLSVREATKHLR